MAYTHTQKNIGSSPRKLRLVADMVRRLSPEQALDILKFTDKAAAGPLSKAIQTAMANAGNAQGLVIERLEINEGLKMKRYRAGGRGTAKPFKRRLSHIKIVLDQKVENGTKD